MARRRRLILDSGAVIALARHDAAAQAALTAAWEQKVDISVPTVVVAETLRGRDDDAPVHRILKAVGAVTDSTEADGRVAGRLLGEHDMSATVDALIVASTARLGGGVILTGDGGDLARLAQKLSDVHIEPL